MKKKMIPMAICYDFDGTLSPRNMQEYGFLDALNIKQSKKFWQEARKIEIEQQADGIAAYMYLMIKKLRDRTLPYTRKDFNQYGKSIELYDGLDTWFERVNRYAKSKGVELKHYIISSGLQEIIEGTKIASKFAKIFASSFMYDQNGAAEWPAVVLNYTSKTQYLFRINKGCEDITENKKINEYVRPADRTLPFTNMIYIGDGDTDIPCMKIVKREGGHAIAVYKPNQSGAQEKVKHLIEDDRVNAVLPADYSAGKKMEQYVQAIIDKIVADQAIGRFK